MDKIQKILIQAGRKDLAQEYYKRTAAASPKAFKELAKNFQALLEKETGLKATYKKPSNEDIDITITTPKGQTLCTVQIYYEDNGYGVGRPTPMIKSIDELILTKFDTDYFSTKHVEAW